MSSEITNRPCPWNGAVAKAALADQLEGEAQQSARKILQQLKPEILQEMRKVARALLKTEIPTVVKRMMRDLNIVF